ncbi:manganese-dependent inorganic pyrophosphatase [Aerococcus sp. 150760007-1]|uniref:Manganese-dependent inorganic pyrophosphatase n=1 Tax=Aerococcus urinaeequi TaxID=51665 RepID=A0ABR5ZVJ3_9LACT|nr:MULTISPECIES: manganese-dependent inorganic pyrophosphatase [Lactobacillales]KAF3300536.1 manganese-dependent inorganic pyrophosphatase [Carnobacterium sp. PL12RED10]MBA5745750.1 manganese-dependent inorganic pyrophosphatase [Aerococcus urinaeequi]MBA5828476.1 manganese-dependent inorganic pyrophosphatase [Aerococcus urinaeequi]MBA5859439.1 manganese-dependent inorganic pyrophosphatase [Aerococcus urinaeequi]HCT98110.1 manganese-dependent inorganic pyrophosphatase [Aerococcus urinaeequi]
MNKILVFGHQNPDTDAITSAISYAYLLNQQGLEAEAVALGQVNEETAYALNEFGQEAPRVIESIGTQTDTVALVDHNESQQSVADLAEVEVHSVVDHHKIGDFTSAAPLTFIAKPYGCSQTIIFELFQEKGIEIPKEIAGLMLSAIISDTLLFKSPTTTEKDQEVGLALAEIAGVDVEAYGLALLKSGTNVDAKSASEIADGDAKSFEMDGKPVRIGQINVVDVDDVLKRKDEVIAAMKDLVAENEYTAFLLVVTNILTSDSEGLLVGSEDFMQHAEQAFGGQVNDNHIALPGVVSRKKQVVPPLEATF